MKGLFNQLDEILSQKRKSGFMVFLVDDVFMNHALRDRIPRHSADMLLWVDVTDEPKTGYVDSLVRQVKGFSDKLPDGVIGIGGGSALGSVNAARYYVRLTPHEERTFKWSRLLQWPPWRAFQGNFTQAEVQQQIRKRLRGLADVRIAVRNPQTFVRNVFSTVPAEPPRPRRGPLRILFAAARPTDLPPVAAKKEEDGVRAAFGGLLAKVGRMKEQVGKVNTLHPHALPWADLPLVMTNLFGGEEGIAAVEAFGQSASEAAVAAEVFARRGGEGVPLAGGVEDPAKEIEALQDGGELAGTG